MSNLFFDRFLARCALIGARRCSLAKRLAAFTSLADSDRGHLEARASRVHQLLRGNPSLNLEATQRLNLPAAGVVRRAPLARLFQAKIIIEKNKTLAVEKSTHDQKIP